MGEVVTAERARMTLRVAEPPGEWDGLLVRDAARSADGLLESAEPFRPEPVAFAPPSELLPTASLYGGPRPLCRVGAVDLALVNGLFGDPLLHLRLRHESRSLLFDLGYGDRLSGRVAHQVSDVFISHAHMDHLGGFLWLLLSRIGDLPPCRLYGPPGLAQHVSGLVEGFLWDRVGEQGPVFEVTEMHGDSLHRHRIRAGRPGCDILETLPASDGVVRAEPGFRVRAVTLDHHTPVLAYAFEPERELHVRKDRLQSSGLAPGPWLTELKQRLQAGDMGTVITLPNAASATVRELGRELVWIAPGKRLVYATDLADTPDNRERLVGLARNAHTLFLEAVFIEADRANARRHGHLTARACGEIAAAAGVSRLVPFHLSRRYASDPQVLFEELEAACGCVVLPRPGDFEPDMPSAPTPAEVSS
jgi:ribonuclease BN (tRNA processing enzyme)